MVSGVGPKGLAECAEVRAAPGLLLFVLEILLQGRTGRQGDYLTGAQNGIGRVLGSACRGQLFRRIAGGVPHRVIGLVDEDQACLLVVVLGEGGPGQFGVQCIAILVLGQAWTVQEAPVEAVALEVVHPGRGSGDLITVLGDVLAEVVGQSLQTLAAYPTVGLRLAASALLHFLHDLVEEEGALLTRSLEDAGTQVDGPLALRGLRDDEGALPGFVLGQGDGGLVLARFGLGRVGHRTHAAREEAELRDQVGKVGARGLSHELLGNRLEAGLALRIEIEQRHARLDISALTGCHVGLNDRLGVRAIDLGCCRWRLGWILLGPTQRGREHQGQKHVSQPAHLRHRPCQC